MAKQHAAQLNMELTLRDEELFPLGRFYASGENGVALEAAKKFSKASPAAFVITGGPKSGKSHLLKGIRMAWGRGPFFSGPGLAAGSGREMREALKGAARHPLVCIDDLDAPPEPKALYDEVFNLFNRLAERGGHLAVAMKNSPARAKNIPDYLSSRLLTGMVVTLRRPGEEQLRGILMKVAHDRNIRLTQGAADYILTRSERSAGAMLDFVRRLEEGLGASDRRIGLHQIRRVLS